MAIPLDDLEEMMTRSRRASGTRPGVPPGQAAVWAAYGGQADAAMWANVTRVRKVCAEEGDIAYFPWEATGRCQEDTIFTAAARQDLPRLLVERRLLRARLREHRLPYEPLCRIDATTERRLWKRIEAATPEPWYESYAQHIDPQLVYRNASLSIVVLVGAGDVCHIHPARPGDGYHDARFIATARWAVPRLAADLLAMRQALDDARDAAEANGD